jgi:hypothetical protein
VVIDMLDMLPQSEAGLVPVEDRFSPLLNIGLSYVRERVDYVILLSRLHTRVSHFGLVVAFLQNFRPMVSNPLQSKDARFYFKHHVSFVILLGVVWGLG